MACVPEAGGVSLLLEPGYQALEFGTVRLEDGTLSPGDVRVLRT